MSAKTTIKDGEGNENFAGVNKQNALNVYDAGPFGKFTKCMVTYPTTSSEVFTYYKGLKVIGTLTVTYLTSSKKDISEVERYEP